jgi:GntR family transcriptional regulator
MIKAVTSTRIRLDQELDPGVEQVAGVTVSSPFVQAERDVDMRRDAHELLAISSIAPVQIAAILRDGIKRGDPAPDRPLPSYTTLMQQHEVARGTAAKAVPVLVEEGLVRIVPGAYVVKQQS